MEEAGEPLTLETFRQTYRGLLDAYFGPDFTIDPELELECFRIPHFYSAFYVYKYATGISAAVALSQQVLETGDAKPLSRLSWKVAVRSSRFRPSKMLASTCPAPHRWRRPCNFLRNAWMSWRAAKLMHEGHAKILLAAQGYAELGMFDDGLAELARCPRSCSRKRSRSNCAWRFSCRRIAGSPR